MTSAREFKRLLEGKRIKTVEKIKGDPKDCGDCQFEITMRQGIPL
jgi:hypothetical protein